MKLVFFFLFLAYLWGVWKFWRGYQRTNFNPSSSNRLLLSALWPVLFAVNQSYRQNFRKALRG